MRFRVHGSEDEISGRSYTEIVSQMAAQKLGEVKSFVKYRKATARRVEETFGKKIDTENDEAFVKSLEDAGLVERL